MPTRGDPGYQAQQAANVNRLGAMRKGGAPLPPTGAPPPQQMPQRRPAMGAGMVNKAQAFPGMMRPFPGRGMAQGNAQPPPFMPQAQPPGQMQFPGMGMMQGNAPPRPFLGGGMQSGDQDQRMAMLRMLLSRLGGGGLQQGGWQGQQQQQFPGMY